VLLVFVRDNEVLDQLPFPRAPVARARVSPPQGSAADSSATDMATVPYPPNGMSHNYVMLLVLQYLVLVFLLNHRSVNQKNRPAPAAGPGVASGAAEFSLCRPGARVLCVPRGAPLLNFTHSHSLNVGFCFIFPQMYTRYFVHLHSISSHPMVFRKQKMSFVRPCVNQSTNRAYCGCR
jgi:hypothetical protein